MTQEIARKLSKKWILRVAREKVVVEIASSLAEKWVKCFWKQFIELFYNDSPKFLALHLIRYSTTPFKRLSYLYSPQSDFIVKALGVELMVPEEPRLLRVHKFDNETAARETPKQFHASIFITISRQRQHLIRGGFKSRRPLHLPLPRFTWRY